MIAGADGESDTGHANQPETNSRTELDTHANMIIAGKHCYVIAWTGRNATVNPFTPDYDALKEVPIVDAAIMYECPYSGKEYILLLHNALTTYPGTMQPTTRCYDTKELRNSSLWTLFMLQEKLENPLEGTPAVSSS
jgi:hypothetical protein